MEWNGSRECADGGGTILKTGQNQIKLGQLTTGLLRFSIKWMCG